jgi:tungstate transport system ATP-binding protein
MTLLCFRQLRKSATDGASLLDIEEFEIPAGSCTLLSGRNGVGKTTLLKIIAGLEAPDAADVEYHGQRLPWHEARRRYAREVIYLHQNPYLFDRSVAANVAFGLHGSGLRRGEIARRVEQALAAARLEHLSGRHARELSGGEQQRVALTRALVRAPRLLLLDEPLASLDEDARARSCDLLRELKAKGIALVLTSHEKLSLTTLADYHFGLDAGRLVSLFPHGRAARRAAHATTVVRLDEMAGRRAFGEGLRGTSNDERHH